MVPTTGDLYVHFSNGDGTFNYSGRTTGTTLPALGSGLTPNAQYVGSPKKKYRTIAHSFNGDGVDDILIMGTNGGTSMLCPFTGTRITYNPCYTLNFPDFSPINVVVGDFNGDGISDIAYAPANTAWTPGSGIPPIVNGKIRICYNADLGSFSCEDKTTPSSLSYFFTGDFNMDGTSDLAQINTSGQITTYSNVAAGVPLKVVTGGAAAYFNLLLAADLNGDGKIDVVSQDGPSKATQLCYSRGDGNFDCAAGPNIPDAQIIFGNFINGNQTTSIASGNLNGTFVKVFTNPTTYPDLLTTVENGIGGKTDVSYKLLTDSSVYTKGAGSIFPIQEIQTPIWVLSRVRQSDGNGGQTDVQYKYVSARYHLGVPYSALGKGFLGFQQVEQIDVTKKTRTSLYYHQTFPLNGQVAQVSTLTFNDKIGSFVLTAEEYFGYSQRTLAKSYHGQVIRALTVLSNKQEKHYDVNSGNLISDTGTTFQHDEYGNVMVENRTTSEGYTFQIKRLLTNVIGTLPDDTDAWHLGRVDFLTLLNVTPEGKKGVKTRSFTYDSRVNLLQDRLSPNSSSNYLATNFTYDSFGNTLTRSIAGSNLPVRTETMTYDYQGQSLVSKENAYGHVTQFVLDFTNGNLLSVTDPNGLITKWNYDSLGRKIKETRPDGTSTRYSLKSCTSSLCGKNHKYYTQTKTLGGNTGYSYFDVLDRKVDLPPEFIPVMMRLGYFQA